MFATDEDTEVLTRVVEFDVLDQPHLGKRFHPKNPAEMREAKALFGRLREAGYFAYREDGPGSGTVINAFDETAPRTVFVPQMIGG